MLLSVQGSVGLFGNGDFRQRRQVVQRGQPETPQECGRGAIGNGLAGQVQPFALCEQPPFHQRVDQRTAVNASYMGNEPLGDGLVIGGN